VYEPFDKVIDEINSAMEGTNSTGDPGENVNYNGELMQSDQLLTKFL
jgi:hypothetical protein